MHVGAAPTFFVDIANPFFGQHPVFSPPAHPFGMQVCEITK
jgi:hypothetical protein